MFTLEVNKDIKLALLERSFAKIYHKAIKENFVHLNTWFDWPKNSKKRVDILEFIQKSLYGYADGKSMDCAIFYKDDFVGHIGFNTIDKELKKVIIGYWLVENAQNKGIITLSCKKLIDIAFKELKMQKVEIRIATENKKSRAVCERLGFKLEGVISNAANINGDILDYAIYALHQKI